MLSERIIWENYEPADFQAFCNALLSFEISKNFVAFNAPGRDTGYDGQYNGTYNGKTGLCKFQYKFHKTARKTAIAALKNGLSKELEKTGGS